MSVTIKPLIGSRIWAFDWYRRRWPWMTLIGVIFLLARQPNGDDEVEIRCLHSCLSRTVYIASFMFSCKQFKSSCIFYWSISCMDDLCCVVPQCSALVGSLSPVLDRRNSSYFTFFIEVTEFDWSISAPTNNILVTYGALQVLYCIVLYCIVLLCWWPNTSQWLNRDLLMSVNTVPLFQLPLLVITNPLCSAVTLR